MLKVLLSNIQKDIDLKDNLLKLKELLKDEIKEGTRKDALLVIVQEYSNDLIKLLSNEDPKIRKNTVLVFALVPVDCAFPYIFEGYSTDDTNYNKAAYLQAIEVYINEVLSETDSYIEKLNEHRKEILSSNISDDNRKHVLDEMKYLNRICLSDMSNHIFTGLDCINELVLTTNRNFKNITEAELDGIPHKEFTAGVMVKTKQLSRVLQIRTYQELLFVPDGCSSCPDDPSKAVAHLLSKNIIDYISSRHNDTGYPFRFRTDYRTKDEKKKAVFEKKFSAELELNSDWSLINSTSDYELEFRLIDTGKGTVNVLLHFCTLPDKRFSYRKATLSVGMKPYIAALCSKLTEPYMLSNSAVLDPFCGSGIMLVEREKVKSARLYYGIDLFGEAVNKAALNIKAAGMKDKTELINKDFFEFHHEYKFNEVFTDMPFCTDKKTQRDIEGIYRSFFQKIGSFMEADGILSIYTRNRDLLRKYCLSKNFKIEAEFEISKIEGSYLFILRYSN